MEAHIEVKRLGEHDVVKKNYAYLLLAQQNGFFQDGYDKDDIATCSDWVVAWWINELGERKKDKKKFVEEFLPRFKRWIANGVNSTGVGSLYEILKMAEISGIRINSDSFSCISGLLSIKNLSLQNDFSDFDSMSKYFAIKKIIDNLVEFNKKGIPLCHSLSHNYDCLLKLSEDGEIIDFDTFIFFHTAGFQSDSRKLNLYDSKQYLDRAYNYSISNADEVIKMNNWIHHGGYNSGLVMELEERIKNYEKLILCDKQIDKNNNSIMRRLNQNVSVSYYVIDENGNKKLHKISGSLISVDENQITLKVQNVEDGTEQSLIIKDEEKNIIFSIESNGVILYNCRTLNERLLISKTKTIIKQLRSENILDKYIEKFGSIEGLAYLRHFASEFISIVNKNQFPIDNLFACCFENIYSSFRKPEETLQYTLAAYEKIMAGEIECLKRINYGYPANKFLSQEALKTVQNFCYYVVSQNIKVDLPSVSAQPLVSELKLGEQKNVKPDLEQIPLGRKL